MKSLPKWPQWLAIMCRKLIGTNAQAVDLTEPRIALVSAVCRALERAVEHVPTDFSISPSNYRSYCAPVEDAAGNPQEIPAEWSWERISDFLHDQGGSIEMDIRPTRLRPINVQAKVTLTEPSRIEIRFVVTDKGHQSEA